MAVLSVVAGAVLILVAFTDVLQTLLHPSGRGRLSRLVLWLTWRTSKRFGHTGMSLAGVSGVCLSILVWVVLEVLGWALVDLPGIPAGFTYASGIVPAHYSPFWTAVYVSGVAFSTVGFGDVVATAPVLRFLGPVEALTGFAVLTAAVSWFTQLYPALSRRRSLAVRLAVLDRGAGDGLLPPSGSAAVELLQEFSSRVVEVSVDLQQNAPIYYFRERETDQMLPGMLLRLLRVVQDAEGRGEEEVRWEGAALREAVATLTRSLGTLVHAGHAEPDAVVRAVVDDYGFPAGRAA